MLSCWVVVIWQLCFMLILTWYFTYSFLRQLTWQLHMNVLYTYILPCEVHVFYITLCYFFLFFHNSFFCLFFTHFIGMHRKTDFWSAQQRLWVQVTWLYRRPTWSSVFLYTPAGKKIIDTMSITSISNSLEWKKKFPECSFE